MGSCPPAALMAVWTSRAAPSIWRVSANCSVICMTPVPALEVICRRPAISPNWRSSGVTTEDTMVCGSAPGSWAVTWMVGVSTVGRAATGSAA